MMMHDETVQLALGFIGVAGTGILLSIIGWLMVRSADKVEPVPHLAEDLEETRPAYIRSRAKLSKGSFRMKRR